MKDNSRRALTLAFGTIVGLSAGECSEQRVVGAYLTSPTQGGGEGAIADADGRSAEWGVSQSKVEADEAAAHSTTGTNYVFR